LIEELFSFAFVEEAANVVLIGANGLGKTMLLKNLAYQAVLKGCTARFTLASDMLHDLAAQDSSTALARRVRRYTSPAILAIDEVGYLSYDARYADLFFEVITRRTALSGHPLHQQALRGMESGLPQCRLVVTLVDRLVHEPRSSRWRAKAIASRRRRSAPSVKPNPANPPRARRDEQHAATQRSTPDLPPYRAFRRGSRQPRGVCTNSPKRSSATTSPNSGATTVRLTPLDPIPPISTSTPGPHRAIRRSDHP
jgi:hypothetical protein